MQVLIHRDAAAVARAAADLVGALLTGRPEAVLALPTGNTPRAMYAELAGRDLDWSRATTFNLDEYVGLAPDHPGSYRRYMHEHLVSRCNLPAERCRVPDGMAADLARACQDYEDQIHELGGLDLAVLGIGLDGHLAFNEPPSSLYGRTRVVRLARSTREANAGLFPAGEGPPERALTMGIGTLLQARSLLLLATGANKAKILAQAVEGPLTALVPASAIQLHPQPVVMADEAAAADLSLRDYYREAYGP